MKHYIGLDVSLKTTAICIMAQDGKIIREMTAATDPLAIATAIKTTKLTIEAIAIEAGGTSRWLVQELQELDLPAICIDSRKMAAAIAIKANKTDKNDAREIANALRTGYFQEVYQKNDTNMSIKSLVNIRRNLVIQRTMTSNCIRGTLRCCGKLFLGSSSSQKNFIEKVTESIQDQPEEVAMGIRALLVTFSQLHKLVDEIDKKIEDIGKNDEVVQLLMTVPGVGIVTAVSYKVEIGDPKRFTRSRSVGAYVGMTPRQYSSGETEHQGKITKIGSNELRALLSDAAMSMMYRCKTWSRAKVFGLKINKKHGHKKAIVALGRKLGVIMHRMWTEGKPFEAGEVEKKEIDKVTKPSRKEKKKSKQMAA